MSEIHVPFLVPFIDAVHSTFKTMMGRNVNRKEIYRKINHVMFGDISGVVGVSGKICGTSSVSLPGPMAIQCIGDMMGEEISNGLADTIVQDGVGEIINMVSGSAKTALANTEYEIKCTLPTIISGRGHELYHREGTYNVSVIFETDKGEEFALDICMEE